MFTNEVIVNKKDKDRLVELLREAHEILEKYPFFSVPNHSTVTTISRAKTATKEAKQWCELLHIEKT